MARHKHKKSCSIRTISFRTKRGKHVSFRGRSGGQKRAGGVCANVADKPGEKRAQREFAKVARHCHGKSRAKRNACVRAGMR
jgi:ABC-type histidine transport system ATPase subunit